MFEIEVVLNASFGGFSFNTEMALWLLENRGWTIVKEKDYDYKAKYPINCLVEHGHGTDWFYVPDKSNDIELRSHPDLIDCVRALKSQHKSDKFPERYYDHIQGLKIKKVKVSLSIEDYHDGKERIVVDHNGGYDEC